MSNLGDKWYTFLEKPIAKPLDILWNYWDAGVAVAGGLAWSPYGVEFYGEHAIPMMVIAPALGLLGPLLSRRKKDDKVPHDAVCRNFAVGATTVFIAGDVANHQGIFLESLNKLFAGFFAYGSWVCDSFRGKGILENNGNSLENSVS